MYSKEGVEKIMQELDEARARNAELEAELAEVRADLVVTEKLLAERQRLLDAFPECAEHGPCVPHAIEHLANITAARDRLQVECDAWRGRDLVHHSDLGRNKPCLFRVWRLGIGWTSHDAIDDAVDALMAEREES